MRLSRAVQEFVGDLKLGKKSPNTIRAREADLHRLVALAPTDTVLHFTPDLVRRYMAVSSEAGLKMSTLHRRCTSVRAFAKWGTRRRYWADDPTETTPYIGRPDCLPRPFDDAEMGRLLALDLPAVEDLARALLVYTGGRVSMVCSLVVGNVSFDPPQLRAVVKGGRTQVIELHPVLADKLAAHLMSRPNHHASDPVLAYQNGRALDRRTLQKWTRRWGAAAEVPGCTPHRFRHAFGTALLEATKDLRLVQEAMGHRSIQSTAIYTRVSSSRLRSAISGLSWGRQSKP
jgi:site-specific recombinase XerC